MLQTTVVIKLTGLLLLTPNTQASALPLHVLMPDSGMYVPMRHTPEIGFIPKSAADCKPRPGSTAAPEAFVYDAFERVCYVNMDGWSMEIGDTSSTPPNVQLPIGTNNLSTVFQRYVDRSLLSDTPDARIRSRLTLNEGAPGPPCDPFSFFVHRRRADGTLEETTLPLTSVLDWEIKNFQRTTLALVRRRLNPRPGDKPDTVAIVSPVGNAIRVYVRQLSDDDRQHLPHGALALRDPATHFHAYFDVLKVPVGERRLPELEFTSPTVTCSWSYAQQFAPETALASLRQMAARVSAMDHPGRLGPEVWPAPGTASCMVSSALPASP